MLLLVEWYALGKLKRSCARQDAHAWVRHDRIDLLASEVLAIVQVAGVGWRLEFAFGAPPVAIAEIGEQRRLNEDESAHSLAVMTPSMITDLD
jgi:hypothetical protein